MATAAAIPRQYLLPNTSPQSPTDMFPTRTQGRKCCAVAEIAPPNSDAAKAHVLDGLHLPSGGKSAYQEDVEGFKTEDVLGTAV